MIILGQLNCLEFGLITPGTDVGAMLQLVLCAGNAVEDSKVNHAFSLASPV